VTHRDVTAGQIEQAIRVWSEVTAEAKGGSG